MKNRHRGFTLLEVLIAVAIVGILASLAYPSYLQYVIRASREGAQSQLLELANVQEKIYLNSSAYSSSITGSYTGRSDGGLGVATGKTADGNYTLSVTATTHTFTLTATPVSGAPTAGDGNLAVNEAGVRTWGSKSW